MKIIHCEHNIEVDFNCGEIRSIIIENPRILDSFVLGLYNSTSRKEDKVYILDNFEKIEFAKLVDLVFSPLELTYEKKDIQKKLLQNILEEITESDISYRFSEICSSFLENIYEVKINSEYEIDFDENLEMQKLIKCFDIHLKEPIGSFVERIVEYISVMSKLMGKQIFILVGCAHYIDNDEYKLLQKHVAHENVAVLTVEGRQNTLKNPGNQYIMDVDLCEI